MGSSFVRTPSFSMIPALFKSRQADYMSYLQFGLGIGNMFGFVEGSFFYDIGGYTLPFYVNAGCLFGVLPFIIKYIPSNK